MNQYEYKYKYKYKYGPQNYLIVSCYTYNKLFSLSYLHMYLQLYFLFWPKKMNNHKDDNMKLLYLWSFM